jgi:hypothetical protein
MGRPINELPPGAPAFPAGEAIGPAFLTTWDEVAFQNFVPASKRNVIGFANSCQPLQSANIDGMLANILKKRCKPCADITVGGWLIDREPDCEEVLHALNKYLTYTKECLQLDLGEKTELWLIPGILLSIEHVKQIHIKYDKRNIHALFENPNYQQFEPTDARHKKKYLISPREELVWLLRKKGVPTEFECLQSDPVQPLALLEHVNMTYREPERGNGNTDGLGADEDDFSIKKKVDNGPMMNNFIGHADLGGDRRFMSHAAKFGAGHGANFVGEYETPLMGMPHEYLDFGNQHLMNHPIGQGYQSHNLQWKNQNQARGGMAMEDTVNFNQQQSFLPQSFGGRQIPLHSQSGAIDFTIRNGQQRLDAPQTAVKNPNFNIYHT